MKRMNGAMTNLVKRWLGLVLLGFLVACGGGGGSGTAPFGGTAGGTGGGTGGTGGGSGSGSGGGTGTAAVVSIDVVSSAATLGTGVADVVTITATVKDAGNVGIASAPIVFAADSGNLINAAVITDASGRAVVTLSAGSNKANRTVKVTATSGSVSGAVDVAVVSAVPSIIDVVASANRVGTGGSPITITAVVKSSNNVTLANTPIQFSSDTGSLAANAAVTNQAGVATASFSPGSDKTNRTATITVLSGGITGQIQIPIDGTTITVSGPDSLKLGDTAQPAVLSFKATDSTGAPISALALALTGTLGNVPSGATVTTDVQGAASFTYPPTVPGNDVVTIRGAGATVTTRVAISGLDFAIISPAPGATINVDPAGSSGTTVSVRYLVNGTAPADGLFRVRFTSTAGSFLPSAAASAGIDIANGVASVGLASRFAGPGTIQATIFSPSSPNVPIATTSVSVNFVATTPATLVLQVSPSAIGPNLAGSTTQQAEARATVLDAATNPVAGVVVNFSRVSDPSGGNLLQASALTDANGIARVQYVSGAQSTATDGVTLLATVATAPGISGQARLTVNQNALFIALGTGNTISNVNETTYRKQWTAYVTDSTGAAVPNVTLTISALPTKYGKGTFVFDATVDRWVSNTYLPTLASPDGTQDPNLFLNGVNAGRRIFCPSEDLVSGIAANRNNGVLDPGEDVNASGRLEPGNVISVNGGTSQTTIRTDSTGFAIINLEYAESYAYWVEIALKVATIVAGTEASNTATFLVPGASADYSDPAIAPAGQTSPFGVRASCSIRD